DVELDALPLLQRAETVARDRAEVDENVLAGVVLDEAESLALVEPLHGALHSPTAASATTSAAITARRRAARGLAAGARAATFPTAGRPSALALPLHLVEAVAAIHRAGSRRHERHRGLRAAARAHRRVHFASRRALRRSASASRSLRLPLLAAG